MEENGIVKREGEGIYELIPNRYPLMLLNSLEVKKGEYAVGREYLKKDDWFFECHYPEKPIYPGCLLIETMTQVFSATFLTMLDKAEIPVISKLGGEAGIQLLAELTIGDSIRFEAELKSFKRGIAKGHCVAYKENSDEEIKVAEFDIIDVIPSMIMAPR